MDNHDIKSEVLQVQQSLGIIGRSPLLIRAIASAVQAAPHDVSVLVLGENGSGKEVFHKILHNYSGRRHKKAMAINCGALPDGTINSELFGHVKGAYTGSVADRKGMFEEADGGTIFLDEIGELPLESQARLLRVLETGEFSRMGSNEVKHCDVRIVAATNKDLLQCIADGTFREDLYYRLSTVTIRVPSLKERPEDINLLFRKFASDAASKYNVPRIELDDEAKRMLVGYSWPGNVRQLLHLVEEISIIEPERLITADILSQHLPHFVTGIAVNRDQSQGLSNEERQVMWGTILQLQKQLEEVRQYLGLGNTPSQHNAMALPSPGPIITPYQPQATDNRPKSSSPIEDQEAEEVTETPHTAPATASDTRPKTMEEIEKHAIQEALNRNHGSKRKAAEELGISERTIHRKILDYNLM